MGFLVLVDFIQQMDNEKKNKDFLSKQNPEFIYKGKKYVRAIVWNDVKGKKFSDGSLVPETGSVLWMEVEPVTFEITNWDNLPSMINPSGKEVGGDDKIELESEEIILSGLPFYPCFNFNQSYLNLWQNSLVRCFFNSAKSEDLDGNKAFDAQHKWDFSKSGFLYQAFDLTREPTREYIVSNYEKEVADYAFDGCLEIKKLFCMMK